MRGGTQRLAETKNAHSRAFELAANARTILMNRVGDLLPHFNEAGRLFFRSDFKRYQI